MIGRALGLAVAIPLLAWAVGDFPAAVPGDDENPGAPGQTDAAPSNDQGQSELDTGLFAVKLWNPRPEPAQPEAPSQEPERRPSPPRVQLVAIINEDGQLRAALYDLSAEKLLVLSAGETVQQYEIQQIVVDGVVLSNGQVQHELRIREDRS